MAAVRAACGFGAGVSEVEVTRFWRKVSAARRLATSPAAAPPMPSQTTKTPAEGEEAQASSLFWRTRPGSESIAEMRWQEGKFRWSLWRERYTVRRGRERLS